MPTADPTPERLWEARAAIYAHFAATGRAPSVADMAVILGMKAEAVASLYRELHARHAILLDTDGTTIRMANPFSGVATGFRVTVDRTQYWANCAWDALGIPATLHRDAAITIEDPAGGTALALSIVGGQVVGDGRIHFLLPFSRWYDDLVET
jgi:Alkylmercury lyase